MTTNEFKEVFDLRYNNALAGAPGLDLFEISVYLTLAQEQLVKSYYDIDKDPTSSFESKERARRVLNELLMDERVKVSLESNRGLMGTSTLFELDGEVMYIVLDSATIKSLDKLYNGKIIEVVPVTHDDFFRAYKNPFRKPNKNKAFRLDISREKAKTTVEIVSEEQLSEYAIRYITYPNPIILTDLANDPEFSELNLSIDGKTGESTCRLASQVHNEIIDRAVELAALDYNKQSDLKARVAMNQRV